MFANEFAQDALFGFTDAGFVFLEAVLDVGDAVNHDLPEQRGEFACKRFIRHQATAPGLEPTVEPTERLVHGVGQAAGHRTEQPPGPIGVARFMAAALAACRLPGARPVQVKCFSVGQRVRSVPTSPIGSS